MTRTFHLLIALVATCLTLVGSLVPRAYAVGSDEAAAKAAGWVASQAASITKPGDAADALLTLAAAKDAGNGAAASQLMQVVQQGAAEYAKSPEGAAKLSILASTYGLDPKDFSGLDLVEAVTDGVKSDGAFGANPGAFASGLGLIALARADQPIPQPMVDYLVKSANSDGGFGYASGQPSDADSTGMALLGLVSARSATGAEAAITKATTWATGSQAGDGSWAGYNPVNSTAVMASALQAAGTPQQKALDFLVAKQATDGSFADSDQPNLLATNQAALLLADTSYLGVEAPAGLVTAAPTTAAPSATATATQTPDASPSGAPSSAEPTVAATTAAPAPASGQGGVSPWPFVIAALALAALAVFLVRRRGATVRPDGDAQAGSGATAAGAAERIEGDAPDAGERRE